MLSPSPYDLLDVSSPSVAAVATELLEAHRGAVTGCYTEFIVGREHQAGQFTGYILKLLEIQLQSYLKFILLKCTTR